MLDSNYYIKYIYYSNSTKLDSIIGKNISHALNSPQKERRGGKECSAPVI